MGSLATWTGLLAAALTTVANVPQVVKSWRSGETSDLSLITILTLASGLALWIVYGLMQSDVVIVIANALALSLALSLLVLKLRNG